MGFFGPELKFALVIAFGAMSVGNILVYPSPAGASILVDLNFDAKKMSIFNAIAPISAIFGSPLINIFMNKYGRKISSIIAQVGVVFGYVLLISTNKSYSWLAFISRSVSGIFAGACTGVIPVYIGELAPPDASGAFGTLTQLSLSLGTVISYGYGCFAKWRLIAILDLIPCAIFLIFIWFCPDSPVKSDEYQKQGKISDLLSRKYVLPIIISLLTVFFQQFSGINALLTNLNSIFASSKISINSNYAALITGSAQFISTLFASFLIGKFGNKVCWIISSAGQAAALYLSWANDKYSISKSIPIICLFADILLFGIGLGPIPWFVVVQVFPDSVRSIAAGINQGINWLLCSVMIFVFTPMVSSMTIGWVYFFYAVIMTLSVFYGIFLLPTGSHTESDSAPSVVTETLV